jgi:hypothetical protein
MRLADALGLPCLLLWVVIILVGTYVQFGLPRWEDVRTNPVGCFMTDALVMYVDCREVDYAETSGWLLTTAWWLSWGLIWPLGFFPLMLHILVPAVLSFWLAVRYVRRAVRPGARSF